MAVNLYKFVLLFILCTWEPICVLLGERRVWKGTGSKQRCKSIEDNIIYIPLLDTLQSIFKNQAMLSEVIIILYILLCIFNIVFLY